MNIRKDMSVILCGYGPSWEAVEPARGVPARIPTTNLENKDYEVP